MKHKHRRMGMAHIDALNTHTHQPHQYISHPYLTASSTLVSSSPPHTPSYSPSKHTRRSVQGPHSSSSSSNNILNVFLDGPAAPRTIAALAPSSFHASAAASRRPPSSPPHPPPKFNAEALRTLAARSTRSPLAHSKAKPPKHRKHVSRRDKENITMSMDMSPDVNMTEPSTMASSSTAKTAAALPPLAWKSTSNDIDFFAPSPPRHNRVRAPFRRRASSPTSNYGSPSPRRRRSSSTFRSTPSASPQHYKGTRGEASVDRALGGMMYSLRLAAHHATPSPQHKRENPSPLVSRWSSSSDDGQDITNTSSTSHSWFARKSNESSRSKHNMANMSTVGGAAAALTTILSRRSSRKAPSIKSTKSLKSMKSSASIRSIKSGKSVVGRAEWASPSLDMDVDVPLVPVIPHIPSTPSSTSATISTPSRGRRIVEGLIKRLTPRKNKYEQDTTSVATKEAKDKEGKQHTLGRHTLNRSRTAPSTVSLAKAPEASPMPPPPVPPLPAAGVPRISSHATMKSVISRKMSTTTLRLGKGSPRSSTSSPSGGRSASSADVHKSVSAAASTSTRRPPLPAFDAQTMSTHSLGTPKSLRSRNRRSASVHLPPPLPLSSSTNLSKSTPPRTPSTPHTATQKSSNPATPRSPQATPRTPSSTSQMHFPTLRRSLSRPSHDLLIKAQADMHGMEGCVPHKQRHSRSPIAFPFHRQRSTMSLSLSAAPSAAPSIAPSAASSSLHLPSLASVSAEQSRSTTPTPSALMLGSMSAGPVLMPRASYFEPQSPSPSTVPLAPFPTTTRSPARASTIGPSAKRKLRNVKSTIGLPTLVSTTSEAAFCAATGRPMSVVPPWAPKPEVRKSDEMEIVVDDERKSEDKLEKSEAKPDVEESNVQDRAEVPAKPVLSIETTGLSPVKIVTPEPEVSEVEAGVRLEPLARNKSSGTSSANTPFPADSASFISTDSCDDAAEVITFSTPVRARRATATTIFSVKAAQALAGISPPSSPPGSPVREANTLGQSPKTRNMLRTLEKLEAASHHKSQTISKESTHARTGSGGSATSTATAIEAPALCRTASDAPSAFPSESDGIKTPPSIPGTPFAEPPSKQAAETFTESTARPVPVTVPLAPEAAIPAPLANFSADFSAPPHPTGTLVGKAARAAALAAANDPLKPRRLLQLLPRQQARLAQHKRVGGIFEPTDTGRAEIDVEVKDEETAPTNESQAPEVVIELAEDVIMTETASNDSTDAEPMNPEIGLPIPPASSPTSRRASLPKLPPHLDREARMRADSIASRVSRTDDTPRRWPAWPPKWDSIGRARAGTVTSVATFGGGAHGPASPDAASPAASVPPPTAATAAPTPIPATVDTLKKKGHAQSASVHTFGGSHCSGASIADLDEFGVFATVAQRRKDSELSLFRTADSDNDNGKEIVSNVGSPLDFSRRRPRAGTTATTRSAWSLDDVEYTYAT